MNTLDSREAVLDNAYKQLETTPALVRFVRAISVTQLLRDTDNNDFQSRRYDAGPLVEWALRVPLDRTSSRSARIRSNEIRTLQYGSNTPNADDRVDVDLSDAAKRTLLSLGERLVDAAYENEATLDLRPPRHVEETASDLRDRHVGEFSDEQIRRHVRHARNTIFGAFDSGRAANAIYPDSRFDELQALMALGGCGTPQGQSRMETFFGENYTPHSDTHLRTVKNYSQEQIQAGFDRAIENLLDAVNHLQILQPPVTVAIDITTWPYYAEDELPREVCGTDDSGELAYKFATLSLVGKSMPIVLAVEPVIESSAWDDNVPHQYHRTVRRLVRRAQAFVTIDLVLADRGFESLQVYQTLDNLGVTYLLPKIERSPATTYIEQMEQEDTDVAVEQATVRARHGSHDCRALFVPNENGDIQVFITNKRITAENAEAWVNHYAYRWWIEAEYRTIKQEFLARTSSKDHTLPCTTSCSAF